MNGFDPNDRHKCFVEVQPSNLGRIPVRQSDIYIMLLPSSFTLNTHFELMQFLPGGSSHNVQVLFRMTESISSFIAAIRFSPSGR
jgi:hypothetical protein